MKETNFPKNKLEYISFVESLALKTPEVWTSMDYDRRTVILLRLLYDLWETIPNPGRARNYIDDELAYARKRRSINKRNLEENPGSIDMDKFEPASIKIIEKWMFNGIDPEDICTVLRDAHLDGVYNVLDRLKYPQEYVKESDEAHFDIYEVKYTGDYEKEVASDNSIAEALIELLISAMPVNQPDTPQWC